VQLSYFLIPLSHHEPTAYLPAPNAPYGLAYHNCIISIAGNFCLQPVAQTAQ
jgi:hypothetical protein